MLDSSEVTRLGYAPDSPLEKLTRRQFEILRLVALGLSNKYISEQLGIKTNSVSNHLQVIYKELGLGEDCNQRVSATLMFYRLKPQELQAEGDK